MSLGLTVADLRCRIRRDGARAVLGKLPARLRAALSSSQEIVVIEKDLGAVTEMEVEEKLRMEDFGAGHLAAMRAFNRKRCNLKADARAAAAVERGYRGFVAYVGDELVGYYWWVDGAIEPRHADIERFGLGIELQPGEVYGYDFYLLEEHRGDGKSMEFLHKVETSLRDLGYRRLWGYVEAGNRPARWLYGLRGYKPVRKVVNRRKLGRRLAPQAEPA
jgi:GNAT superfamily N-acetyltransferase